MVLQRYYRRQHPSDEFLNMEDGSVWAAVTGWIGRLGWAKDKEGPASMQDQTSANLLLKQLSSGQYAGATKHNHQYASARRTAQSSEKQPKRYPQNGNTAAESNTTQQNRTLKFNTKLIQTAFQTGLCS